MNIRPVSDLRNYNDVLQDCDGGEPVFLTRNGRGVYVVQDIKEYKRQKAILRLTQELQKGLNCKETCTAEEVKKSLGLIWGMYE